MKTKLIDFWSWNVQNLFQFNLTKFNSKNEFWLTWLQIIKNLNSLYINEALFLTNKNSHTFRKYQSFISIDLILKLFYSLLVWCRDGIPAFSKVVSVKWMQQTQMKLELLIPFSAPIALNFTYTSLIFKLQYANKIFSFLFRRTSICL